MKYTSVEESSVENSSIRNEEHKKMVVVGEEGVEVSVRALVAASQKGDVLEVTFLLDQGVNVNDMYNGSTPLHFAIQYGHFSLVQLLIDRGADVNAEEKEWHQSPLHFAIYHQNFSAVQLLIDRGSDVNAKDICVWTPLHFAVHLGYSSVVQLLIDRGSDVNPKTSSQETLLDLATGEADNCLKDFLQNSQSNLSLSLHK
eukprot:TRINITY_DN1626_c0_g1_i4.p1 TRINITY_DN1626_c0_g1~~TRINITY_DN1626_c0_g1_i4.p1  ORF type:complete len:200 (-),score=39.39 TRINITY_DN1626_c0_g1_i4:65-664(-)